ncbi:MAG: right-handed parallel beta-helix repeat-containing protein [Pirellulales bacterium]
MNGIHRVALRSSFILPFAALTSVSFAAQFYVSTTGNNSAAGTADAPWQTLQYAAGRVNPGDRVTVRPGAYAGFNLTRSGTAAAPIEFFAEPGVLVNRPNPVRADQGINLENASYVIVDGFEVTGMNRAGVRSVCVDGDTFASHVTIRNVYSHDNGYWGILTGFVDDLVIENNRTSGSVNEHGIYVSNSGDRPTIRNNVSWNNRANGIHMNGDASLGGDGIITGALVSGNIIFGNGAGGGSGINMDGVQDSRVENNLIYDQHSSGISLYQIDGGGGSSNNEIINNTIQIASNGRWALNIQDGSTGNQVFNNILLNNHSFRGAMDVCGDCLADFESDYNVLISRFTSDDTNYNLAQWQTATGNDLHSLVATAANLFVNPSSGDYHLLATAAARDAGTLTLAPLVDLDGKPRPIGAKIDVGAYEFGSANLAGDFNTDGTVDAADYAVWRDGLGTIYTQADYDQWRSHFGQSSGGNGASLRSLGLDATGSASAVPEPAITMQIAALLLVFTILSRVPRLPRPAALIRS